MSTLVTGHYTFFLYFCNLRNNIIRLSQKGRWIKVLYTETRSVEVIYLALWTDPEGDSCFSIYRISWINYYLLIWWILNPDIHSFKGILFPGSWTPKSGKFFFYGIRNPELWNSEYSSMNPDPINDWNPESNFHWQNPVHVYFESGTSGVGIQNRDCFGFPYRYIIRT